jgi:predicted RNase H-like HicB family nuclease
MSTYGRISVGLEQGADGMLWVHPLVPAGCAARGSTPQDAVALFEREYQAWLRFALSAGEQVPPDGAELEVTVDEWIETGAAVGAGESRALFAADVPALGEQELGRGMRLLGDLRGRLLSAIRAIPRAELEARLDGNSADGWTVRSVLEELARAQWWTLSRLGASPLGAPPEATLGRLDTAMALVVQQLGELEPARRGLRVELEGEEWTPRKVLRRLLWLEWWLGSVALAGLAAGDGSAG